MSGSRVPLVDVAPFSTGSPASQREVARAVDRACTDIGFLVVVGHGVDQALVDRAFGAANAFFAEPLPAKLRAHQAAPFTRGYTPMGLQALAYSLDVKTPPDLFERYTIGPLAVPEGEYGRARAATWYRANLWPERPVDFAAAMSAYYRAMERLAADLMRLFAVALDLPATSFDERIDRHISRLCLNHYPPPESDPLPGQLRAGAHSDYGSLTILATGDQPGGLQVMASDGSWHDVMPEPGAFIVNIGDLMAQWTNDRWVSTVHRVVPPARERWGESRRTSLVFFHQPNEDALIECLPSCMTPERPARYAPTTSGAHLAMKVAKQRSVAPTSG